MNGKRVVRFGSFEANLQTGELRNAGIRIRLQEQPFRVLALLLDRAGELVSREELKQALWQDSEYGDFDQGLNVAIKKIRTALGDSSDTPRFIETWAKKGYRLIAPVTVLDVEAALSTVAAVEPPKVEKSARVPRWAIALVIGFCVLLSGWWLARRPKSYSLGVFGPVPSFRIAPLTGSLGFEMDPQFSPDGKQIAYVWTGSKKDPPGIFVKVLGAGNPVRLLPPQENVAHIMATWSPDGRFIACVRRVHPVLPPGDEKTKSSVVQRMLAMQSNPPECGVYLLPAIGGEEKKLFDVSFIESLRWSPDGQWFLISAAAGRTEPTALWRYSLDGTKRRQLTVPVKGFRGDSNPTFSPDGKWISFVRNWSSGGSDIFIIPASGGAPRRVTNDAQYIEGMSFSPDGKEIIFSSARAGGERLGLWRIPVEGGAARRLPFGTQNVGDPVMSQTGDHLAYIEATQSGKIWSYPLSSKGKPAGEPSILIGSRQLQVGPQYSPDGKRIAFTSSRSGSWEIWVCAADGSNPVQLTSFGDRQTGTPRWSPDGKFIVFDARPKGHSEIYAIDSEGGTPRQVTRGSRDSVVPSVSRDGVWIYYSSNVGGSWDLWKTRSSGQGAPVQVTHNGGFSGIESADGKILYYAKWDTPGIFSMPVGGGPEFQVTPDLLPKIWGAWGLTKQGIYLLRPAQKANSNDLEPVLSFFDFKTKSTHDILTLVNLPSAGPSLAVSPDGTRVLVAHPDDGGSEIMIVDNFR